MSKQPTMAVARPSTVATVSKSEAARKLERDETPLKARIPTILHRKLKVYAFEHGTTMEALVLKGLEKLGFSTDGKKVPSHLDLEEEPGVLGPWVSGGIGPQAPQGHEHPGPWYARTLGPRASESWWSRMTVPRLL